MASLPNAWKQWVLKNLLKGVPSHQILETLLSNGFTFEAARKALGSNLPASMNFSRDSAFYLGLTQPKMLQSPPHGLRQIETELAQFYVIEDFLSPQECATLVEITKSHLRPSELSVHATDKAFRTSSSCDLTYVDHEATFAVDAKIVDCLGVGIGEKEVIQAQHYSVGQEFKAHTDYFEPGSNEYKDFAVEMGQRTWTFMVYLTEGCDGGDTEFHYLKQRFSPKLGRALVWNNLNADGTPNVHTMHQAHPVTKGEKVVITKWFRERDPN